MIDKDGVEIVDNYGQRFRIEKRFQGIKDPGFDIQKF
jgi:hypothetical protein